MARITPHSTALESLAPYNYRARAGRDFDTNRDLATPRTQHRPCPPSKKRSDLRGPDRPANAAQGWKAVGGYSIVSPAGQMIRIANVDTAEMVGRCEREQVLARQEGRDAGSPRPRRLRRLATL